MITKKPNIKDNWKKMLMTKEAFALCVIVIIGAVLRFWNFPYGYGFDSDAIRDAIIVYEGARNGFFPLAGAFSSTGPYTFGPWFYITNIFFSTLFPFMYTPWVLAGITSLISIVVMYDIGRLIRSKYLGLLLALLTALTPSEIITSTSLSNLTPVAFFAILSLWVSTKILTSKHINNYWYFLLGIFLGLGISAHYQSFGLMLMPVLVWFFAKEKSLKTILFFVLGFAVTFIPILIFNFMNDWHTVRGIQEMYATRDRIYVANSWKIYILDFWPSLITFIFGTPRIASLIMLALLPLTFGILALRKKIEPIVWIPALVLFVNFIYLRFYWGERSMVYHFYLEPLIIFLIGVLIYKLYSPKIYRKVLFSLALIPLITFMCLQINRHIEIKSHIDTTVAEVDTLMTQYPNKRFHIYKCDQDRGSKAEAVAYVLKFHQIPESNPIQNIGVASDACAYPSVTGYNFQSATVSAQSKNRIYPLIKDTTLHDFSKASMSAIQKEGWYEVTTEKVFNKSARWY